MESSDVIELAGGTVEADHGCFSGMMWRIIPRLSSFDVARSVEALQRAGWRDAVRPERKIPLLYMLEHADGHRLVIAAPTRRIQLRLHYMTNVADRTGAATRLARALLTAIE